MKNKNSTLLFLVKAVLPSDPLYVWSGGPDFKSSPLPLQEDGVVFGGPRLNSSAPVGSFSKFLFNLQFWSAFFQCPICYSSAKHFGTINTVFF